MRRVLEEFKISIEGEFKRVFINSSYILCCYRIMKIKNIVMINTLSSFNTKLFFQKINISLYFKKTVLEVFPSKLSNKA